MPYNIICRVAAMAAALVLGASCGGDPSGVDDEPEVATVVVTIAGTGVTPQVVTWNVANNSISPAQITVASGSTRTITAAFLRADGSTESLVTEAGFRLDFAVTGTRVTITKPTNLTASLTAATTGTASTFTLSLFHLGEGHTEYGPSNAITVVVP